MIRIVSQQREEPQRLLRRWEDWENQNLGGSTLGECFFHLSLSPTSTQPRSLSNPLSLSHTHTFSLYLSLTWSSADYLSLSLNYFISYILHSLALSRFRSQSHFNAFYLFPLGWFPNSFSSTISFHSRFFSYLFNSPDLTLFLLILTRTLYLSHSLSLSFNLLIWCWVQPPIVHSILHFSLSHYLLLASPVCHSSVCSICPST